ncbi:MAG: hypothetical protein ABW086_17065 [Sedimenticola sp.]
MAEKPKKKPGHHDRAFFIVTTLPRHTSAFTPQSTTNYSHRVLQPVDRVIDLTLNAERIKAGTHICGLFAQTVY